MSKVTVEGAKLNIQNKINKTLLENPTQSNN